VHSSPRPYSAVLRTVTLLEMVTGYSLGGWIELKAVKKIKT